MKSDRTPNKLINASSPYLLQHAYNPVQWQEWSNAALQQAFAEDKPMIVSIGYAACHWCHVMERECFENDTIAEIMNKYFVCIKVDREERPDIDQIYMDAVHAMGLRGGWPLNVILTREAKPFYGGTYFPPAKWQNILLQIAQAYMQHRDEIEKSGESFRQSISRSEVQKYGLTELQNIDNEIFKQSMAALEPTFDTVYGGIGHAPKFPMPAVYEYLLSIYMLIGNKNAITQAELTLDKMALGGIFDPVEGAFARYSTDERWFLPHFEKMLYDNGQLLSLYTLAQKIYPKELYTKIIYKTIAFVQEQMSSPEGGFYCAYDADSEGEEGKYYVWKKSETEALLGADADIFNSYYNIIEEGNWEHGHNVLYAHNAVEGYCEYHHLDIIRTHNILDNCLNILKRNKINRIKPALDDKILCSWNGLMLNGLVDAYRYYADDKILQTALKNAYFIATYFIHEAGLWHNYKDGKTGIQGFLEDYAFVIQAFINLYQATFEEAWLWHAKKLTDMALHKFHDEEDPFLFFTPTDGDSLIARKKEIFDNVIPASNTAMAQNLYLLGHLLDEKIYIDKAQNMVHRVANMVAKEPYYMSKWGVLLVQMAKPLYEVCIIGNDASQVARHIDKLALPNIMIMGSKSTGSTLPLLQSKTMLNGATTIYICQNKTCEAPLTSIDEVLRQLLV
ncbi:MAG: thioredoxin domain-containing protein [Cytophagales bacterium]|nr:thioredoxin domain-containing protein [Cytophagales bacterium]